MPDSAESSAEVIVFDAFDAAEAVAPEDGEQAARRFRTLLVDATPQADPSRTCVRRARNTQGETFAVKSLFPLVGPDAGIPDRLNEDAVRALSGAFFESYRNLLLVSGLDGFPRAYGYGLVGQTPVVLMEWVEGPSLMEAAPLLPHAPEARGGGICKRRLQGGCRHWRGGGGDPRLHPGPQPDVCAPRHLSSQHHDQDLLEKPRGTGPRPVVRRLPR